MREGAAPQRRSPTTSEGLYEDLVAGLGEELVGLVQRVVADALLDVVRRAVADAMSDLTPTQPDTAIAVSVAETAKRLSLGLTTTKNLVNSGQIRSILVERRRLVPVEAIHDYVCRLEQDAAPCGHCRHKDTRTAHPGDPVDGQKPDLPE
jgi:excisionase family DNA binding protein